MIFSFNEEKFKREIGLLKKIPKHNIDSTNKTRIKSLLMNRITSETNFPAQPTFSFSRNLFTNQFFRYAATMFVGLGLVGGSAFASNSAKPGDLLFPVKKVTEQFQVSLTASKQNKAALHAKIAEERIDDMEKVPERHKGNAKVEAEKETAKAVEILVKVQDELLAKGNLTAANAIAENITRLHTKAEKHKIQIKAKKETPDKDKKDKKEHKNDSGENSHENNVNKKEHLEESDNSHRNNNLKYKAESHIRGLLDLEVK